MTQPDTLPTQPTAPPVFSRLPEVYWCRLGINPMA
jgi:hypothetical protein